MRASHIINYELAAGIMVCRVYVPDLLTASRRTIAVLTSSRPCRDVPQLVSSQSMPLQLSLCHVLNELELYYTKVKGLQIAEHVTFPGSQSTVASKI